MAFLLLSFEKYKIMIIISHIMILMIIIITTTILIIIIIIIIMIIITNKYFPKNLASCSLLSDVIRHGMAGLELTFTGWISCFLI